MLYPIYHRYTSELGDLLLEGSSLFSVDEREPKDLAEAGLDA